MLIFLCNQSETSTYWEIREQLDDYRQKTGALYVYTLGINENSEKVHILIDGMGKGNKKASPILTPTTATSFQDVESVMKGKASTTSIVHDPEYGDYLSFFVPIKNGNEVIRILGVDIDASKVDDTAQGSGWHPAPDDNNQCNLIGDRDGCTNMVLD